MEQEKFLRIINRLEPKVLSTLAKHVLPSYQKLYEFHKNAPEVGEWIRICSLHLQPSHPVFDASDGDVSLEPFYLLSWSVLSSPNFLSTLISPTIPTALPNDVNKLRIQLQKWGKRWNVWFEVGQNQNQWFFDCTLNTLNYWCRLSAIKNLDWYYRRTLNEAKLVKEQDFSFSYHPWDYDDGETWKEYEDSIRKNFDEALKQYHTQLKKKSQEYKQNIKKEKRDLETHLEMLIDYVINGLKHEAIRAKFRYQEVSTIAHIIPETAQRIDLTLPNRRGKK